MSQPLLPALFRTVREVKQYRDVLQQLVRQFLTLRYRRTALGYLWTLVNPVLMMTVTAVVFATLFKVSLTEYAVFLFAGLVPWNFFSMFVTQSCVSFIHNEGLIKKIYLPKILFPLTQGLGMLIDSMLALVPLFAVVLLFGAPLTPALLFLPVAYLLLFAFTFGIALVASVATVFFRDLQYVTTVMMQAWFFLTPVMYQRAALQGKVGWVISLNPMTSFIELFRAPLAHGRLPPMEVLLATTGLAALTLALGFIVFVRNEHKIVFRL